MVDKKLVSCQMCKQVYSQMCPPLVLSDGHTFCTKCLKTLEIKDGKIRCPLDKNQIALKNGSINELGINHSLIDLINELKQKEIDNKKYIDLESLQEYDFKSNRRKRLEFLIACIGIFMCLILIIVCIAVINNIISIYKECLANGYIDGDKQLICHTRPLIQKAFQVTTQYYFDEYLNRNFTIEVFVE
ncbi:unnamed protein product, partial [Brachionus calyciflorus]